MKILYLIIFIGIFFTLNCSQPSKTINTDNISADTVNIEKGKIKPGAELTDEYLYLLEDKYVGVVANQTSIINNTHLVDSLLSLNVNIIKIFCPEHGFRGTADAGEIVNSDIDEKTGLPIISLYGNNKKPKSADLEELNVIIFDIQDVGARFYTYISTMHYIMEACAENNVELIVLDRPNPNGYYVDGPVLDTNFRSFVGMHPVPVVHGMTIGEYAKMINGEGWLKNGVQCNLKVIKIANYDHTMKYELPVKPSPNLPNARSIELYPSLCFFEGTDISIGRGTDMQFQVVGHPIFKDIDEFDFSFTPQPNEGAKNPPHNGVVCYGLDIRDHEENPDTIKMLNISYLIELYKMFPDKEKFFLKNNMFNLLAGNKTLQNQIIKGLTEIEIRKSWQKDIDSFKLIRKKYLLYQDFE